MAVTGDETETGRFSVICVTARPDYVIVVFVLMLYMYLFSVNTPLANSQFMIVVVKNIARNKFRGSSLYSKVLEFKKFLGIVSLAFQTLFIYLCVEYIFPKPSL